MTPRARARVWPRPLEAAAYHWAARSRRRASGAGRCLWGRDHVTWAPRLPEASVGGHAQVGESGGLWASRGGPCVGRGPGGWPRVGGQPPYEVGGRDTWRASASFAAGRPCGRGERGRLGLSVTALRGAPTAPSRDGLREWGSSCTSAGPGPGRQPWTGLVNSRAEGRDRMNQSDGDERPGETAGERHAESERGGVAERAGVLRSTGAREPDACAVRLGRSEPAERRGGRSRGASGLGEDPDFLPEKREVLGSVPAGEPYVIWPRCFKSHAGRRVVNGPGVGVGGAKGRGGALGPSRGC